jgi:hypothetical protein
MAKTIRREYTPIRLLPDPARAAWEADLARIALRRAFEGWPTALEQGRLTRAS